MLYKNKQLLENTTVISDEHRKDYVCAIENYIVNKNEESKCIRTSFISSDTFLKNKNEYRQIFRDMLGINKILEESIQLFEKEYIGKDDVSSIYRIKVYITKDLPFYAMLMIPHNATAPFPLAIVQHGGGGTPELCSDFDGKNNYNHIVQRTLERGVAVISPQLLLWSLSETDTMRIHNVKYDRSKIDNSLKRFGMSITGLEVCGIIKCIDYACNSSEFDSEKIAMLGLSYGGYYTLHTMAADERIKAGYAAGFFNDRDVYDWFDWCYKNSANMFHDAEVAALCAPRKLYVSVGKQDEVFNYKSAICEAERAKNYFKACHAEKNFIFSLFDGGHTIENTDDGYEFIFESLK